MPYSRDTHHIAAYMRRHFDHVRKWSREGTLQWVKWFLCHGRAISLTNGHKMVGVVLVRLVDQPEQAATYHRRQHEVLRIHRAEPAAATRCLPPKAFRVWPRNPEKEGRKPARSFARAFTLALK